MDRSSSGAPEPRGQLPHKPAQEQPIDLFCKKHVFCKNSNLYYYLLN